MSIENWQLAGIVTLTGLTMVFAVLVVLILFIRAMGLSSKKNVRARPGRAPSKAQPVTYKSEAPPVPVIKQPDGLPDETVAVITAVVASLMSPGASFTITHISPRRPARSEWGLAGLRHNVQPF